MGHGLAFYGWGGVVSPPGSETPKSVSGSGSIRAEIGMEILAQQRYMGWEDIKTALHYVHLSGRHGLDAARAARPALPMAHVEDRV